MSLNASNLAFNTSIPVGHGSLKSIIRWLKNSRPEKVKTPRALLLTHFRFCTGGVTFTAIKTFFAVCANKAF